MFSEASVSQSVHGGRGLHPGGGDLHPGGGERSASRGGGLYPVGLHPGGRGLHPGEGSVSRGVCIQGEGVCIRGAARLNLGGGGLGRHPSTELGKWAVRILLECFRVCN